MRLSRYKGRACIALSSDHILLGLYLLPFTAYFFPSRQSRQGRGRGKCEKLVSMNTISRCVLRALILLLRLVADDSHSVRGNGGVRVYPLEGAASGRSRDVGAELAVERRRQHGRQHAHARTDPLAGAELDRDGRATRCRQGDRALAERSHSDHQGRLRLVRAVHDQLHAQRSRSVVYNVIDVRNADTVSITVAYSEFQNGRAPTPLL